MSFFFRNFAAKLHKTRKDMKKTWILLLAAVLLAGCKDAGRTLPSATGSIYECLIVAPTNPLSQSELATIAASGMGQTGSAYDIAITNLQELINTTMAEPMPCMPQAESYFKTTCVSPQSFDDFLRPTRNILYVDINPERYTQLKVKYLNDNWSQPQAMCYIQAANREEVVAYWLENGLQVREWFIRREMQRAVRFLHGGTNKDARTALQNTLGVDMLIPSDYQLIKDTTDFIWCCNNKGPMRKDLVIYRYPYTDANTFTAEYLNSKRDEVLSRHITASVPGSYMGTEYNVFPPQYRAVRSLDDKQKDFYAGEIRGLWKIKNGEAMGGPYVSHTRVDEINHQVVTAEVFIFASGQKKRNALRQAEAVLYTLQLQQEMNALQEVEVK